MAEGSNLEAAASGTTIGHYARTLTPDEVETLKKHDLSVISEFEKNKLEHEAAKNWDLFYKRNKTNFYKDRHWTLREFEELSGITDGKKKTILEVGCGVGNFFFPLFEELTDIFVYACDLSPRAIEFVKQNPLYGEKKCQAFVCDLTQQLSLLSNVPSTSVDVISVIFVLSAIDPLKHSIVVNNLAAVLSPGGRILLRDYGLYDQAQLRFKRGHKIQDNFYKRQDNTRCYYFEVDALRTLFEEAGFEAVECRYVQRQTVNKKEDVSVPRVFVQAQFVKKAGEKTADSSP